MGYHRAELPTRVARGADHEDKHFEEDAGGDVVLHRVEHYVESDRLVAEC